GRSPRPGPSCSRGRPPGCRWASGSALPRRLRAGGPSSAPRTRLPAVDAAELAATDQRVLWHPFTPQQTWSQSPPLVIERGEGTTLIDVEGRRYIDGVSSLWCNVHGHR